MRLVLQPADSVTLLRLLHRVDTANQEAQEELAKARSAIIAANKSRDRLHRSIATAVKHIASVEAATLSKEGS